MTAELVEWSDIDELIISGLAAGMSHAATADLAGVSTKTIQRRLRDEVFVAEVRRRRGEQVERVSGQLTELSVRAVATLGAALGDESASIRLRAADLSLTWMVRLRREADLERRVAEIENELASRTAVGAS